MPRLLVHRGETLYREIDLTDQPVRIGRNPDNDLILEDVGKSVSRHHADIRYENGRYVLVDRESQNGVWVSGSRLPRVVLEPGIVASVGPYRLMLDSTESSAAADATHVGELTRETIVVPDHRSEKVIPPVKSVPPRTAADEKKPVAPAKPKAAHRTDAGSKWVLGGLAAVILLAASAVGIWFVTRQSPPAVVVALDLEGAKRKIESGDCEGALRDVEALLATKPADDRGLEVKRRAEACLPTEPPKETDVVGEHLIAAARMLESGDCAAALTEHINPVLELDAENVEAAEMKKRAEACVLEVTKKPPTPTGDWTSKIPPPEKGGLIPIKGEAEKNYYERVQAMKDRYDKAVSILSASEYQQAVGLFEGIVRDTPPRYLDASERLAEARARQKEGGQKYLLAARDFEMKGEWDLAIAAYERAARADRTIKVDADIARITAQKSGLAKKACGDANVHYAFGRTEEALKQYQTALRLLPQNDPCVVEAKGRFPDLAK